jgi:hypothetical protein
LRRKDCSQSATNVCFASLVRTLAETEDTKQVCGFGKVNLNSNSIWKLSCLLFLDFPDKSSPRLKARFYLYNTTTYETHKMTNEEAMKKALAELESSSKPNYTEIAKKYEIGRHALLWRH